MLPSSRGIIDTVDKISRELTRLEVTVAKGFQESESRDGALAERVSALETSVADGFRATASRFQDTTSRLNDIDSRLHHIDSRLHDAELRDLALIQNIDVHAESLRADIKTVLDAVGLLANEMRRTSASIRAEDAADREMRNAIINQHADRLHKLETRQKHEEAPS